MYGYGGYDDFQAQMSRRMAELAKPIASLTRVKLLPRESIFV
jgi:hypothetical protein